jgi:ATP-dependent Clp protease ATP-binding subunit ClpC
MLHSSDQPSSGQQAASKFENAAGLEGASVFPSGQHSASSEEAVKKAKEGGDGVDEDMRRYVKEFVIPDYSRRMKHLQKELDATLKHYGFSANDIAGERAGVDRREFSAFLKGKAKEIEKKLPELIIGQPKALEAIAHAVKRAAVGINDAERPIVSLLFLGRTGMGKTATAKALAQIMKDDQSSYSYGFLRVDCSEFAQGHEGGKLIGAPPGYIGHDETARFESVIKNPCSIVLFDEVEKGSKEFHNLLLQILEDGRITLAKGQVVDFSRSIILLSSNAGVEALEREKNSISLVGEKRDSLSEDEIRSLTHKELRNTFKPELLNRLDEIVPFRDLTPDDVRHVAVVEIQRLVSRVASTYSFAEILVSEEVVKAVVDKGYSPEYGGRALRRATESLVGNSLVDCLFDLDEPVANGTVLDLHLDDSGQVCASLHGRVD